MIHLRQAQAAKYGLHSRGATPKKRPKPVLSASQTANCTVQLPLTLVLPFPPSTNTSYATVNNRRVLSAKGRTYHTRVRQELLLDGTADWMLDCRLKVTIRLTMPDHRKRDIANFEKLLIDSLTLAGVWQDDSQIDDLTISRLGVQKPGKVEVTIERIK